MTGDREAGVVRVLDRPPPGRDFYLSIAEVQYLMAVRFLVGHVVGVNG
jgi:hypothetical protein